MHKRTKGNIATYYVVIFLVLGLVGAVLRALELIRHYDRLTGLFEPFAAAPVLPLYVLVCALAAFACSWQYRGDAGPFVDVYALSRRPSIIARIVCGVLLCAAGFLKVPGALVTFVYSVRDAIALRSLQVVNGFSLAELIFGLITILAGVAYVVLTNARCTHRIDDITRFFSTIPIYWSCFLLVMTFMDHPVEPVLRSFAYDLLAGCAMVLAIYHFIARAYDRLQRGPAVFVSLIGITLLTLSVVSKILAALLSGNVIWLTEDAFRTVSFAVIGAMILLDTIPLLNAPKYIRPASQKNTEGIDETIES